MPSPRPFRLLCNFLPTRRVLQSATQKHMLYRSGRYYGLLLLAGLSFAVTALSDQPKRAVHSEADLPRVAYPVTGSVSTLLQSEDSVFASKVKHVGADLDALFEVS